MNEGAQRIPELAQYWKPKRKLQTMEDIEKTAQFQQELREDIERYFQKSAERARMRQQGKIPWWVYLVALLGALVPSDSQEREADASDA